MTSMEMTVGEVLQWCKENLDDATLNAQVTQMVEEMAEVTEAKKRGKPVDKLAEELGDVGVVWVAMCFVNNLPPHHCLQLAHEKNADRDGEVVEGRFVKEEDL